VDTDEFAPCGESQRLELRARFGLPAKAPVILYLGRVAPEKSLHFLLDAFARVLRLVPQAVLVLAGDGPARAALEEQAGKLALPPGQVRFAGMVNPAEVHSWYQAADLYTLVSFNEGFPCALVEAMSAGLASVVTDIPGNRQLIDDGQHGVLVPAGDSEALAAGLVRVIEDDALRGRMGEAARQRVLDNYSLDKTADRYEELFAETLREK